MRAIVPRPTVKVEGTNLVLQSGWRTAFWTLGGRRRKVIVDRQRRLITIRDRRFWISKSEMIVFDRVRELIHSHVDLSGNGWYSHIEHDLFTVGLWLTDGRVVNLFRLYGQGDYVNNSLFPDWMFASDIVSGEIVKHGMGERALSAADVLAATIGVPVGNGPE